jgi:cell wall-associated NlpC family hydrolase
MFIITITPDRIILEANKFLNVPFAHMGRSILGLDCLGLIIISFRKCGIFIPNTDNMSYSPIWWKGKSERLHNHLLNNNFEIVSTPCRGDVVTFRLFGEKYPAHHCGILISEDKMIHTKGHGIRIERKTAISLISDRYKKRIGAYFRYKGYI